MAAYLTPQGIAQINEERMNDPVWGLCDQDRSVPKKEDRHGQGPYVSNGVPISNIIQGCCINDPCLCRSDVIFYDGIAYDQKPFIQGRLRTRPGNVMFYEGKMAGPFNPGKSPLRFSPKKDNSKRPLAQCFSNSNRGRRMHPCCRTSVYGDTVYPFHNRESHRLAYTKAGLPHGNTIGYFRFKPERICYDYDRPTPVQHIEDCCNCHPWEYDASQYLKDECPGKTCC